MLNELFGKMGKVMTDLYKGEKREDDPEFQRSSERSLRVTLRLKLHLNYSPRIGLSLQSSLKSRLSQGWVRKLVLDLLSTAKAAHAAGAVSTATAPTWVPWLAGVAVASLVTGFVFKRIVKKVNQVKGQR